MQGGSGCGRCLTNSVADGLRLQSPTADVGVHRLCGHQRTHYKEVSVMGKMFRSARICLMALIVLGIAACEAAPSTPGALAPSAAPQQGQATTAPAQGQATAAAPQAAQQGAMTDVGTPRNETLIFQTFDRK